MPDRRRQGRVKLEGVLTADEAAGEGMFARLVDRLVANRAAVGGALIFSFVAAMIVTNALFLQEAPHPGPLFATRDAPTQSAQPIPPARPDPVARQIAELPLRGGDAVGSIPATTAPPVPQQRPDIAALLDADSALVADIQRRLHEAGFYSGTIDGIHGSRTRAAISAYERSVGLPETGAPSEGLLARLSNQTVAARQPMPPLPHPAPNRSAAANQRQVQDVQLALNAIGYGPITVDGELGETTVGAIRRFELDNGMNLTGSVNDDLVRRLVAIGALRAQR